MAVSRLLFLKEFFINASCESKRFHSTRVRHNRLRMADFRFNQNCLFFDLLKNTTSIKCQPISAEMCQYELFDDFENYFNDFIAQALAFPTTIHISLLLLSDFFGILCPLALLFILFHIQFNFRQYRLRRSYL